MNKSSDQILEFEHALKNNSSNKPTLYAADTNLISNNYKIEDVILSVSKQIKALQSADCVNKQRKCNISKVKSSEKSLMTNGSLKENLPNKFETQCVSDTQLIEIVQIVEAQADMGTTEQIDTTLSKKNNYVGNFKCVSNVELDNKTITESIHSNTTDTQNILQNIDNNRASNAVLKNSDIKKTNDVPETFEVCKELSDAEDFEQFKPLGDLVKSPILSKINPLIIKTTQSLVCKLDCFEKFEALALPIIEKYPDLHVAKKLINSQIESQELFFETNGDPILKNHRQNKSPILKSKINMNKHYNISIPIHSIPEQKSQQSIIDDEILFSSDEETNYSTNTEEDLPLTCALQTSFYDYTGVLDTTMYVGFQTASNKTIQVHSDSFIKAQSLLNNHEHDNTDLIELVDMFDNTFKSSNNINSKEEVKENIVLSSNDISDVQNKCTDNIFVGFQKANGKVIEISQNALIKGAKLFKDIDANNEISQSHESSFYKLKRHSEPHSGKGTEKNKHIDKESIITSNSPPNIELKKLNNNNESHTIKIVNDIESTFMKIDDDNVINDFETDLFEKEESAISYPKECKKVSTVLEMPGSNPLKLSSKVVEKSKRVFDNTPDLGKIFNSTSISELPGFKTASNKNIAVSEKALLKYQNILDDIDFTNNFEPYQSMENKESVTCVMQEGSLKSNTTFENVDIDSKITVRNDQLNKIHSLQTANNNNIEMPLGVSCKSDKIFDNITEDNIENMGNTSNKIYKPGIELQGFFTANNNPIVVSPKLIDKYKNIFDDIDICGSNSVKVQDNNINISSKDVTNNYELKFQQPTASEKPIEVSKTTAMKTKNILQDSITFKGFQTASCKKICIPKEKLACYLKVFDGIDLTNDKMEDHLLTKSPSNAEVQDPQYIDMNTVSNKNISFSEIEEANSKNLMNSIDLETTSKENDVLIHSPEPKQTKTLQSEKFIFQTASSKPISVTEEAFAASQKIINVTKPVTDNVKNDQNSLFIGFKTGSKRKIEIPIQTLNKAKKFLDSIDKTPSNEFKDLGENMKSKFQFQTANNKKVNVSEEAIIASQKQLNTDFYSKASQMASNKNISMSKEVKTMKDFDSLSNDVIIKDSKLSYKINSESYLKVNENKGGTQGAYLEQVKDFSLNNYLDTQIVNNFEETLNTEDFLKETSPCKRSGSPILSCPKAKKRRFEAPASVKITVKPDSCQNNRKATFIFDSNYKKHKVFNLKDLNIFEERYKPKETQLFAFNFENILDFKFSSERNDMTGVQLSTNNIKDIFAESVNKKIIPTGWIENHLKLIIWKLLSYEIKYSNICYKVCSVKNVMEQLKYRYDRELYNVQRPAFRKILEKDDVPTKTMVVCVVGVYINGVYVSSVTNSTDTIELLLTDGWYCLKACIDKLLAKYVYQGKVSVGTKLAIHGAELINCDQGMSPWEDTSSVRLKLFGNSTRRARWDARLGYHGNAAIATRLSAVKADGGKVSKLRVFVTRVYPTLYVEKFDDGSMVTRSERLENLHQMKYESERQMFLEKIYEDVEKEFYEQESQDSERNDIDRRLETGSQIARAMKKHWDPAEFRATLTESQLRNLHNHTNRHKDKQMEVIQEKVREKLKNSNLSVARNVVPLMKIRVASVEDDFKISKGMISIWRPNEELQEIIRERKWIQVYNVIPTALRYSEIQLSASRQSIFQNCEVKNSKKNTIIETLNRRYYSIRDLTKNSFFNTEYNEVDTVGFLFLIEPSNGEFETSKQLFQNAFLADANKNIICVNFWGGIKKFGFEHILDIGQIVACINLQKRSGNTIKSIPQYRATEFSYFTKTSKYESIREVSLEYIKIFSGLDKRKFQEDCVAFKINFASMKHGNEVSPYRMNNSDYNISKNKIFIDSPITKEANCNLSGLDFESTFKQRDTQDMAPQELLRKKKVNEKIAKLKMYGEPPPLSPLNINNHSKNAVNAFKSPLTTRNNVDLTSVEKSSNDDRENSKLETSPVLPLRRSGKRPTVNPVKLNFNNVENVNNTTDPFADDFDASPPLSLD